MRFYYSGPGKRATCAVCFPLNADGTGRQDVYLTAIPDVLGHIVADRIGVVVPAVQVAELGSGNDIEVE